MGQAQRRIYLQQPIESLAVYFESFDHPTLDFYVDDVVIERAPDPVPIEIQKDIPSLKDVFAGQFKLGTAVLVNEIQNPNSLMRSWSGSISTA
ncbi:Endo-1,4-beta-xylanase A precursor [Paenibacillus sp. P1XP2]|nr:Endo-1,4-beta-xylanase A precursor [Paenibacillus sp. P1XP2]